VNAGFNPGSSKETKKQEIKERILLLKQEKGSISVHLKNILFRRKPHNKIISKIYRERLWWDFTGLVQLGFHCVCSASSARNENLSVE
jgi:hypothetical protein